MPCKEFKILDNRSLRVYKRKRSKNLRLSIDSSGQIKVSIPYFVPYKAGVDFALSRSSWIKKHSFRATLIEHNQNIGKAHHIVFKASLNAYTLSYSIKNNFVTVHYPHHKSISDDAVQQKAQDAASEALRLQAKKLLPQRLDELSKRLNLPYSDVRFKRMKSRWGSCDINKKITLNLYLMTLPWHLIDYVLIHELTHTKVLRHGKPFWSAMKSYCPSYTSLRKEIRNYHPIISGR